MFKTMIQKIESNTETIGVLGLGYVGLPLAVTFAKKGVRVIGFEKSGKKIANVNEGINYIGDVEDDDLKSVVSAKKLIATDDFSLINKCDAILICVPTPLDKFKKPDMTYISHASIEIAKNMKKGTFISLESTTYPTTTEDLMIPIIEKESGLKASEDFWVCFSPERVDPGNTQYKTENTPKVVGALGEEAREIAIKLYGKAIKEVYPVSSPRVAEMVKILENTYRLVNISLVNELALLCGKMNINIWEAIEAAKTKPYGFQAFYPGPGIGGHCIPLDPFYLEYVAKNFNFDLTMINLAGHINNLMPHRMCIKVATALNRHKKAINGSKILVLGASYKADIADERQSPSLDLIDEISKKGGEVFYNDPLIPEVRTEEGRVFKSTELTSELLEEVDCVIISVKHSSYDFTTIERKAKLIVDLRNAITKSSDKVYKL